jgi:Concanavalin A-like lectin/glucanases superfamily
MSYSSTILATSPDAYWRFGEPSGTSAADASGNGHTGTCVNTPTMGATGLLTGDSDTAFSFAAASAERVTFTPIVLSGDFTLAAWIKGASFDAAGSNMVFSGAANSPALGIRLTYLQLLCQDLDMAPASTFAPSTGQTYRVAVTYDLSASSVIYYVNGSPVGSPVTFYNAAMQATGVSSIGGTLSGSSSSFDGTVDEPNIWSRVLSAAEISADYAAGTAAGGPAWTTPADAASMTTTPDLKFTSPTSAVKQHFQLQLDTAATFDSGNLRTLDSSASQTNWTYWNGSTWVAIPSDGLPIAYAGNEVDYTVTSALSGSTWYRRVRAGTLV